MSSWCNSNPEQIARLLEAVLVGASVRPPGHASHDEHTTLSVYELRTENQERAIYLTQQINGLAGGLNLTPSYAQLASIENTVHIDPQLFAQRGVIDALISHSIHQLPGVHAAFLEDGPAPVSYFVVRVADEKQGTAIESAFNAVAKQLGIHPPAVFISSQENPRLTVNAGMMFTYPQLLSLVAERLPKHEVAEPAPEALDSEKIRATVDTLRSVFKGYERIGFDASLGVFFVGMEHHGMSTISRVREAINKMAGDLGILETSASQNARNLFLDYAIVDQPLLLNKMAEARASFADLAPPPPPKRSALTRQPRQMVLPSGIILPGYEAESEAVTEHSQANEQGALSGGRTSADGIVIPDMQLPKPSSSPNKPVAVVHPKWRQSQMGGKIARLLNVEESAITLPFDAKDKHYYGVDIGDEVLAVQLRDAMNRVTRRITRSDFVHLNANEDGLLIHRFAAERPDILREIGNSKEFQHVLAERGVPRAR